MNDSRFGLNGRKFFKNNCKLAKWQSELIGIRKYKKAVLRERKDDDNSDDVSKIESVREGERKSR